MTMTNELRSLNRLAVDLQHDPALLRHAAAQHGITPTITIDGRSYYDLDAAKRIREAMNMPTNLRAQIC